MRVWTAQPSAESSNVANQPPCTVPMGLRCASPGVQHFNPMGTVHGGWFATLLDSALGCAVHTRMPPGRAYTTAELSVNIVRALTPKVQRVRAIGRIIHCGRQLATADAQLIGPDGTLYAHATTTCLVFEVKQPPAAQG